MKSLGLVAVMIFVGACGGQKVELGDGGASGSSPTSGPTATSCEDAGSGPIVLASGLVGPASLAVSPTQLYWDGVNAIQTVSVCGGEVSTVAGTTFNRAGGAVEVSSTGVFWSGGDFDPGLSGEPFGSAAPVTIATGSDAFALSATDVNWVVRGECYPKSECHDGVCCTGAIASAPIAGGATTTLASNQNPTLIAVDSENVYWTNTPYGANNPVVMKLSVKGGTPTQFAPSAYYEALIGVDATNVYVTTSDGLQALAKADGTATTLVSQISPTGIALVGDSIYWTDPGPACPLGGCDGKVLKVSVDGGSVTTLATGQIAPQGVTADDVNVYWVNQGMNGNDGTVMKLPLK